VTLSLQGGAVSSACVSHRSHRALRASGAASGVGFAAPWPVVHSSRSQTLWYVAEAAPTKPSRRLTITASSPSPPQAHQISNMTNKKKAHDIRQREAPHRQAAARVAYLLTLHRLMRRGLRPLKCAGLRHAMLRKHGSRLHCPMSVDDE